MAPTLLDALRGELAHEGRVEVAAAGLFERRAAFLVPLRAQHSDVQMGALDQFQDAFDSLELLIVLCRDIARDYEAAWLADVDPATDALTLALRNLFWSGRLVVSEILSLLRAGYGVGAHARWRALHEVATQAEFITGCGGRLAEQTARSYLEHQEFRTASEVKTVQALIKRVAPERRFTAEAMTAFRAIADAAVERHGAPFRGDYGWAHATLLEISADYRQRAAGGEKPRGPSFADVAAVVHSDSEERHFWRLLNEQANAAVHGSPRGVSYSDSGQGLPRLMDGPDFEALNVSRVGLASSGRLISLIAAFTHPYPIEDEEDDEDELGRVRVLHAAGSLSVMVEDAFLAPWT